MSLLYVRGLSLLISSLTLAATFLTVKRAKIIRDKSKPSNSSLPSSASSSHGQVGASTPPSDVMVEEHEDEEDGHEDSATDVESSDKDEDGRHSNSFSGFCIF